MTCLIGGCLAKGTSVLMHDGTIKPVEEVMILDQLMGPDSEPRTVMQLSRGRDKMFRMTPLKGDPYVVTSLHVLSLAASHDRSRNKSGEIVEISVLDYLALSTNQRDILKGYRVGVDFPKQKISVDPYMLGAWLGDGHVTDVRKLREVVSAGKHIPQEFKVNSRKVRLEVLAGIIDSSAHLNHNSYDMVFKSKILADDIVFVARSLGFSACRCQHSKIWSGKENKYERVYIYGDVIEIPVRLLHKKAAPRRNIRDPLKTGISIEALPEADSYGFKIDGDQRFLLGDFTVAQFGSSEDSGRKS